MCCKGTSCVFEQVAQQRLFGAAGVGGQMPQQPEPDLGLGLCGRNDVENEIDNLLAHHRKLGADGWSREWVRNRTRSQAAFGLTGLPRSIFRLWHKLLSPGLPGIRKASGHYRP